MAALPDKTGKAGLTEEEASRYDRQMRLWGIEAQQRYEEHNLGRILS